jgi:hypothetical protein
MALFVISGVSASILQEFLTQAVLRQETDRIGLWLDTTAHSPGQTVDAILVSLDASRVRVPAPG